MASLFKWPVTILASLTILPCPTLADSQEWKPVQCKARGGYRGNPGLSAVALPAVSLLNNAALDDSLANRLEQSFFRVRKLAPNGAVSVAVGIEGKGIWQRQDVPESAPLLYWASAGKMATAVVILQLVEEGKLRLSDPVSRWVEGVPNGDAITVRDLAAHTAGLFSANEDSAERANPRYRNLEQELEVLRRYGAAFCPGEHWRYSNSGYALLGEIVRQVDGRPIDLAITERIIKPLGLRSMRALSPGGRSDGIAPLLAVNGPMIEPSWPGAAGPLASDAADMVRFLNALLAGKLIPRDRVQQMIAPNYPMFNNGTFYGMGLMLYQVPSPAGPRLWIGHSGGTPGGNAIVAYSVPDRAFVAVAVTGDSPAPAWANDLLKALKGP